MSPAICRGQVAAVRRTTRTGRDRGGRRRARRARGGGRRCPRCGRSARRRAGTRSAGRRRPSAARSAGPGRRRARRARPAGARRARAGPPPRPSAPARRARRPTPATPFTRPPRRRAARRAGSTSRPNWSICSATAPAGTPATCRRALTASTPERATWSPASSTISAGEPLSIGAVEALRLARPGRRAVAVRRRQRGGRLGLRRRADPEAADPHHRAGAAGVPVGGGELAEPVGVLPARVHDAHAQLGRQAHGRAAVRGAEHRCRVGRPRRDGGVGAGRVTAAEDVHEERLLLPEALRAPGRVEPDQLEVRGGVARCHRQRDPSGVAGRGPAQLLGDQHGVAQPEQQRRRGGPDRRRWPRAPSRRRAAAGAGSR